MIRLVVYFVILGLLAYGGMLLVENPGHVTMTWHGTVVDAPAALLIGAVAVAAIVIWALFRFVFGLPSFVSFARRQRRREKGYAALSRGLIAVGAGDGRTAGQAAAQARRHLKNDPLAIMLRAQAAHMNGEGYTASAAFEELAQRPDTRVLGLRGLHAEALRRGDDEAARHFAGAAHQATPLPWSAKAVLDHRASEGDWEKALATVESGLSAGLIDKETGTRQRAVLQTAIGYDKETVAPDAALGLARSAIKRAPDLAPAVVLAARLLSRRGEIRKASRLIERAWPRCQHPDIAQAYLDVRPGDSTQDRLARARTLMGIATFDPVSRLAVARASLANKDFLGAREAMAPLIAEGKRPTVRQCHLMAELEEAEYGDTGLWREWLARASRAPLDPAWVADGIVYDHWAPASPTTGKLDAFQWQVPAERLGPSMDAMPMPEQRREALAPSAVGALEHQQVASADDGETNTMPDSSAQAAPPAIVQPSVAPPLDPPKVKPVALAKIAEPRHSEGALFHRRVADEGTGSQEPNGLDAHELPPGREGAVELVPPTPDTPAATPPRLN